MQHTPALSKSINRCKLAHCGASPQTPIITASWILPSGLSYVYLPALPATAPFWLITGIRMHSSTSAVIDRRQSGSYPPRCLETIHVNGLILAHASLPHFASTHRIFYCTKWA